MCRSMTVMGNVEVEFTLFPNWTVYEKGNKTYTFPSDMRFNSGHAISIILYSILMVLSATGNLSVLILLIRRRSTCRSRINIMLIHLAVADLLVTFLLMPIEIAWAATVSWRAGDLACRIAAFFRTFGLYQSSFVLVCIGIDRYYAILQPLKLSEANFRGKLILTLSWIASAICSLPQVVVFQVHKHPEVTWYEQCISLDSLNSQLHEVTYSVFNMVMMYICPLLIIIYCYGSILGEICRRAKEPNSDKFRRSNQGFLGKAKTRTLKMTITIITTFFICWTPYYFMSFWFWIDKESAKQVDPRVQRGLFLFACTNSSLNPIVYGLFNIRRRRILMNKKRESNTCTTEVRMQQLSANKNPLQS